MLPKMSVASGVNIVAGTAYYVDSFIPKNVKNMTVEQVSFTHHIKHTLLTDNPAIAAIFS